MSLFQKKVECPFNNQTADSSHWRS